MAQDNKAERGSIAQIILNALSTGDKYGYEICKDIEEKSGGKLVLKQPSLYSSLRRMEDAGLISSYWGDSDLGGRRHYYAFTDKGKAQYEKNKNNWVDYDALMKALNSEHPKSKKDIAEIKGNITEIQQNIERLKSFSEFGVVKQENLFNIAKKEEPQVQKKESKETKNNDASSFIQFDLFNQNLNFVAAGKEEPAEHNLYINKYANAAAHKDNIQPESPIVQTPYSSIDTSDLDNLRLNYQSFSNRKEDKTQSDNVYGANFGVDNILDNFDSLNINKIKTVNKQLSEENELDDDIENSDEAGYDFSHLIDKDEMIKFSQPEPEHEPIKRSLNEYSEVLNDEMKLSFGRDFSYPAAHTRPRSFERINTVPEQTYIPSKKEQRQQTKNEIDYKNILGGLYSGDGKDDPYEKKFDEETFINEVEKDRNINVFSKANYNSLFSERSQQIDEPEISCNNLDTLKQSFLSEGIKLRKFKKQGRTFNSDNYINYAKLKLVQGWILWFLIAAQILAVFLILRSVGLLYVDQEIIYYIAFGISFLIPIANTIYYFINPDRKIETNFKIGISLFNKFLAMLITIVFIFAINLFLGMTSLTTPNYLNYWLLPSILSVNYLISSLLYFILLKSKRYRV